MRRRRAAAPPPGAPSTTSAADRSCWLAYPASSSSSRAAHGRGGAGSAHSMQPLRNMRYHTGNRPPLPVVGALDPQSSANAEFPRIAALFVREVRTVTPKLCGVAHTVWSPNGPHDNASISQLRFHFHHAPLGNIRQEPTRRRRKCHRDASSGNIREPPGSASARRAAATYPPSPGRGQARFEAQKRPPPTQADASILCGHDPERDAQRVPAGGPKCSGEHRTPQPS